MFTRFSLFSAALLLLLFSCALQDQAIQPHDNQADVTILMESARGWDIAQYRVTASRPGESPVSVETSDNMLTLQLQLGTWQIDVNAMDNGGTLIFNGSATARVTEDGAFVRVGLLKQAGNYSLSIIPGTIATPASGSPGSIEKVEVIAGKEGFETIFSETSGFNDTHFMTGMNSGTWTFTVRAMARALDEDYKRSSDEYTVYAETVFEDTIEAGLLETAVIVLDTQVKVTPVIFSIDSGSVADNTVVTLSCDTPGSEIYYTLDGSQPNTGSEKYTTPVTLTGSPGTVIQLRSFAIVPGISSSITGRKVYSIANHGVTLTPRFTPPGGLYSSDLEVAITCPFPDENALITWSLDDWTTSMPYTGPVSIRGNGTSVTLQARATAPGKSESLTASGNYTILWSQVATPVVSPGPGSYHRDQLFTLACGTPGAQIYYTLDGSAPGVNATYYTGPFTLDEGSMELSVIAVTPGMTDSLVVKGTYHISGGETNLVNFTEAEVIIEGADWNTIPLQSGINWLGFDCAAATTATFEWLPPISGIITIYENDMMTEYSGEYQGNASPASLFLESGRYFISINSQYSEPLFNCRLIFYGGSTTSSSTSSTTTTTSSSTTSTTSTTVGYGTVTDTSLFYSATLGNSRVLRIYLPGSYHTSTKRYPVIYMQDGQNIFAPGGGYGCWYVEDAVDALARSSKIDEVIVVGINNTSDRTNEYNYGNGAWVEDYGTFIGDELIPWINTNYRTRTGPANTAVMGSSYGGNAALYLGWYRSDLFGMAGCFSSTLAWNDFALLNEIKLYNGPVKDVDFWIYAGESEKIDPDGNGIQNYGEWSWDLAHTLLEKGWIYEEDLLFETGPGEGHNEAAWSSYVSKPIQFFFGRENDWTVTGMDFSPSVDSLDTAGTVDETYLRCRVEYASGLTSYIPGDLYSLTTTYPGSYSVARGILTLEEGTTAPYNMSLTAEYRGVSDNTAVSITSASGDRVRVNLEITAPMNSGNRIWFIGDYCGWQFGINTVYTLDRTGERDGQALFTGSFVFDRHEPVAFKLCAGESWGYEELDGSGVPPENRIINTDSNSTYSSSVIQWKAVP
jgi:predicted alpha/beta superfamily hydrolase